MFIYNIDNYSMYNIIVYIKYVLCFIVKLFFWLVSMYFWLVYKI